MERTVTLSTSAPAKRSIHRVALACIQCRSRKVRCDATQPTCNRCRADEKQCEYQKSRRGGRPRRPAAAPVQVAVEDSARQHYFEKFESGTDSTLSGQESRQGSSGSSTQSICDGLQLASSDVILSNGTRLTRTQVNQLLTQYYTYFHVSHPCVLPRWSLETRMTCEAGMQDFLLPVLLYIGSIFTHSIDSTPLAKAAAEAMNLGKSKGPPGDPYYVQALMLYSIAVYWCNEPERGREFLDEAIDGAFVLGMHQKDFATQYGKGDLVLEESWRRTWWQIHVTDVNIAGSMHTYKGLSVKFPVTTELPCEEELYETGVIPIPASLKHYDTREFSDIEFSSFAQLVGFTQGISRVLATRRYDDLESAKVICANADTMMTAWCSLLPTSKRRLLREDGSVDELLFKANILMHTYIVDLHRQLSALQHSAIESTSKCAPPAPPASNDSIKDEAPVHTAKVLFAIEKLNSLLTLPTRFSTHTPFIICMIANMTIAHLAACRFIFREPKLSLERDKIRLNMGVLKMLGEFWPAGQREYDTMGIIARKILALKEEEIRIPIQSPVMPMDALDYNFEFGVDWGCDLFGSGDVNIGLGSEGLVELVV